MRPLINIGMCLCWLWIGLMAYGYYDATHSNTELSEINVEAAQNNLTDGTILKNFEYSQWLTGIENQGTKEYTVSGENLGLSNKVMGPFSIGIAKELAIKDPKVVFFNKDNIVAQLSSQLAAPVVDVMHGDLNFLQAKQIVFSEHPVIAGTNGNSFYCQSMVWDKEKQEIKGQGNCVLNLENRVLQAPQMVVSTDLSRWDVLAAHNIL